MSVAGHANLLDAARLLDPTGARKVRGSSDDCCCDQVQGCPDCSGLASSYLVTPTMTFACSHCSFAEPPAVVVGGAAGCAWSFFCPHGGTGDPDCQFCDTFSQYIQNVFLLCDLGYWRVIYQISCQLVGGGCIFFNYYRPAFAGSSPVGTYLAGDPVFRTGAFHCSPCGGPIGPNPCEHFFDIDPGQCVVS